MGRARSASAKALATTGKYGTDAREWACEQTDMFLFFVVKQ